MKKAFVSSVIQGFESFRQSVESSLLAMDYRPIMAEKLSSRAYSSETACLSEVQTCDVYILVLGEKYGFKTNEEISVTQAEYRTALKYKKPILIFIQDILMERDQELFKKEVEKYHEGFFRTKFSSNEELKDLVVQALRQFEKEADSANQEQFLARIGQVLPLKSNSRQDTKGVVIFWPQPGIEIDLEEVESYADSIFVNICKVKAASLKDGFKVLSKKDVVSILSDKTEMHFYNDGLVVFQFSTEIEKNDMMSFNFYYASPTRFQTIANAAAVFLNSKVAWVGVGLLGMENRYFDEPVKGNTTTVPMFNSPYELGMKLFTPFTAGSYESWLDVQIKKFKRTFSKK